MDRVSEKHVQEDFSVRDDDSYSDNSVNVNEQNNWFDGN